MTTRELRKRRQNEPVQQAAAWRVKSRTVVSDRWRCKKLAMGNRVNISRAVRIHKLGKRMSDNAEVAILEWVEGPAAKKKAKTTATAEKKAKSPSKKADAEKKDD